MARAGLVKRAVRVRTKHGTVTQQRMVRADGGKPQRPAMSARMQRVNMIAGTAGGAWHGHEIGALVGTGLSSFVPKRNLGVDRYGLPRMGARVGVQNALIVGGTVLGAVAGGWAGRRLTARSNREGAHGGLFLAGTAAADAVLSGGGAARRIGQYYAPNAGARVRGAAFVVRESIKKHGVIGGARVAAGRAGQAVRSAFAGHSERANRYQAIHSVQGWKGVRKMAARDFRSAGRRVSGAIGGAFGATFGRAGSGIRAATSATARAVRTGFAGMAQQVRRTKPARSAPTVPRVLQLGSGR